MFFSCVNDAIRRKGKGLFFCLKIYSYWIFLATLKIKCGFRLEIKIKIKTALTPKIIKPMHVTQGCSHIKIAL